MEVGTVPYNALPSKYKLVSVVRLPRLSGTVPFRALLDKFTDLPAGISIREGLSAGIVDRQDPPHTSSQSMTSTG